MNLLKYCQNLHKTKKSFAFIYQIKKDNMLKLIIDKTSFLDKNVPVSHRVYCILHNITEIPKCECGEQLKFNQYSEGFREFCSVKCSSNSKSKQEKIKQTNLKKYGHINTFQSEAGRKGWNEFQSDTERVKEASVKGQNTLKVNYNTDTIEEAQKIRITNALEAKIKKYGYAYNNRDKASLSRDERQMVKSLEKTCLEKYGVRNPMQVNSIFDKTMKRSFKLKDYVFPSGKIVQIQGFEHFAINDLLKDYDEDEIKTETKDMPKIFYIGEDKKDHRYIPDIFIPKENLIIEVKSDYTMRANFYTNLLKGSACKKVGYNFKFMVYGNKGRTLI